MSGIFDDPVVERREVSGDVVFGDPDRDARLHVDQYEPDQFTRFFQTYRHQNVSPEAPTDLLMEMDYPEDSWDYADTE